MRKLHRRGFLGFAAAGAGVAWAITDFSAAPAAASSRFAADPFSMGVASGDPEPDGVVLWTKLAPDPLALDGRGGMPDLVFPVRWEVAEDERFRRIVARGRERATPELGHSVHAEPRGLRPDREYFYRFRVGGQISPVGRTRTAPSATATKREVKFAFASCQNHPAGYFTAYRHMAREDLDLVVHLGDYIYEGTAQGEIGRGHLPTHEIYSLADYRVRYGQYKTDPDLKEAHRLFPWVVTWDDHEVDNNYAADVPQDPELQPRDAFLARRAAAYQAYYEFLPLRRSAMPHGPDMRLYRRVTYGRLAEFNVLDTRQYRDDQACDDTPGPPCDEALDPSRSMLGAAQEQWLLDGLGASSARWNIVAQQTVMARADRDPGDGLLLPTDNWNGYEPARQRLFDGVLERGVQNFVVITGDAHCNMATDLKADFADPDSPVVGAEFLGTSISSSGDGADMDQKGEEWLASNPHMKFYNQQRGYVRCTVNEREWRSDYRVVPYVTGPDAPVSTRAALVVESGVPGVQADDARLGSRT